MKIRTYHTTKEALLSGGSWVASPVYAALLLPGDTYQANHTTFSQVQGMEVTPQLNHPSGGVLVPSRGISTSGDRVQLTAGTIHYEEITTTVGGLVLYAGATTTNGYVNPLLFHIDMETVLDFKSSIFLLSWPEHLARW